MGGFISIAARKGPTSDNKQISIDYYIDIYVGESDVRANYQIRYSRNRLIPRLITKIIIPQAVFPNNNRFHTRHGEPAKSVCTYALSAFVHPLNTGRLF